MDSSPKSLKGAQLKLNLRRDPETNRIYDVESGEYMIRQLYDRDKILYSYFIRSRDDKSIVEVVFEWDTRPVTPGDETIWLVTFKFVQAGEYDGPGLPRSIPPTHPLVSRVKAFIEFDYRPAAGRTYVVEFI